MLESQTIVLGLDTLIKVVYNIRNMHSTLRLNFRVRHKVLIIAYTSSPHFKLILVCQTIKENI